MDKLNYNNPIVFRIHGAVMVEVVSNVNNVNEVIF